MANSEINTKPTISKEELIAGVIYQEHKQPINWNKVDDNMRDWIAGNLDADGCVSIDQKHGIRVMIVKAENGWSCLEKHVDLFGGTLHRSNSETDRQQARKIWSISGKNAIDFCNVMKHYTFLKSNQFAEAGKYPFLELHAMQMKPVAARSLLTNEIKIFPSQIAGYRVIGGKLSNIRTVLDKPNLSCAGHRWLSIPNPISTTETQQLARDIAARVHDLKSIEHATISKPLPAAYCAGLMDGDGTFTVNGHRLIVSVGQKYRAIADALHREYSGTIHHRVQRGFELWTWQISVRQDALRFLTAIVPHLIEKAEQGRLVLKLNKENCVDIGRELARYKGRQGKSLKKVQSNVPNGFV